MTHLVNSWLRLTDKQTIASDCTINMTFSPVKGSDAVISEHINVLGAKNELLLDEDEATVLTFGNVNVRSPYKHQYETAVDVFLPAFELLQASRPKALGPDGVLHLFIEVENPVFSYDLFKAYHPGLIN